MTTNQSTGSFTYNRPRTNVTAVTTLSSEFRLVEATGSNQVAVESYLSLDPDAIAKVIEVTITAGTDGDFYDLEIDDGTTILAYATRQRTGMAAADIADALAKAVDFDPRVRAEANSSVISITGVVPGADFTVSESASTTPGNLAVATTTAASGTALHRKISSTTLTWGVNSSGFPTVEANSSFFDGTDPGTKTNDTAPVTGTGTTAIDTMQTAGGIPRVA